MSAITQQNLQRGIFAPFAFLLGLLASSIATAAEESATNRLSFGQEIQPILARKCFACHGPDEGDRQADLRLDQRAVAVETGAIVPGKPDESSLVDRIFSEEEFLRMPPPEAHDQLTDDEKQKLKQWIAEGAEYTKHWAFQPPQKPELPAVRNEQWIRNPIDRFVLARLEAEGMQPAPEADRDQLIRRVSLDLTGLPPGIDEVEQFVNDNSPDAYKKLVDRLLDSPRYGEKWARHWLDLARYSDTNGYEKDRPRSIWPYRDWVIRAINEDMPFDQFTIEQLAGDMLPDPTLDQLVATGFHRNTMLNEEGGIDPLEYRYYAMVDRVATTGQVWMGLTTGCCQCHSHKYDPISHTDYYRLFALLNNADEVEQILPDPDVKKKRKQIDERIAYLKELSEERFLEKLPGDQEQTPEEIYESRFQNWLEKEQCAAVDWTVVPPTKLESNLPRLEVLEDGSIFSTGDITKRDLFELRFDLTGFEKPVTGLRLEVLPDDRLPARGPGRAYYEGRKGDFFLSEVTANQRDDQREFSAGSASYGNISVGSGKAKAENVFDGEGSTGWSTSGREGEAHQLVLTFAEPVPTDEPLDLTMLFERHFAASLGRFRISFTTADKELATKPYDVEMEKWQAQNEELGEDQLAELRDVFLLQTPELENIRKQIRLEKDHKRKTNYPTTLVFEERPEDNPRVTHRHHRGEYLSPEEKVSPGVPLMFPQLSEEKPNNRLTFARWLVSEKNPLVGRVVVNRYWQKLFGYGIVRTPGDFGTQAELPTHPELLDWLAIEFRECGWSRKEMLKLIVMSATYRQSSEVSREAYQKDPENRLLARGPRFRASAETIRDLMLNASGLLSDKMYGPGVYPPQPKSVTALAYGNAKWPVSQGEDRYRRSIYTFSKRTAPFAAFTTFDGPTGETCTVTRDRSNTPLQALTLLNDEMYLEMARAMAVDVQTAANEDVDSRLTAMFRRLLTRLPEPEELETLRSYYQRQKSYLEKHPERVVSLMARDDASIETAALALTSRVLMNLDETVTIP